MKTVAFCEVNSSEKWNTGWLLRNYSAQPIITETSQGLVVAWQHIKLMRTKLDWLEDELGILFLKLLISIFSFCVRLKRFTGLF